MSEPQESSAKTHRQGLGQERMQHFEKPKLTGGEYLHERAPSSWNNDPDNFTSYLLSRHQELH